MAPICILLAQKTGRPVKLINTREEEFTATGHRYPMTMYLKSGVNKDGRLVAWHLRNIMDLGAYYAAGYIVLSNTGSMLSLLYGVPNVKFDGYGVYTNNPWGTGCRGLGGPQVHFAMESQMDIIAERLGIDPVDMRLVNANKPNTVTSSGKRVTSCGLKECIEQAAEASGWKEKKGRYPNRGLGIACFACASGGGLLPPYNANYAESVVKVDERGMVNVLMGEPEVGTGSATIVAIIAAEQLGVPIDKVNVAFGDTDMVPLSSWGTGASRVTFTAGNAVKVAAADARRQIFDVAAELLEANSDDLEAKNGRVYVKGSPDKGMSIGEAVGASYKKTGGPITGKGTFAATWSTPQDEKGYGSYAATYAFAAQVVEVEVDKRTGKVGILNYVAAHDIGYPINPIGVEGQIEGATLMGTGYAVMEDLERKSGITLNPNFMDYRVPTALDAPPVQPIMVETMDPDGPFGAKGIAEPGMVPSAAAIANAIYDAVGIRIKELPLTPMKVRKAARK